MKGGGRRPRLRVFVALDPPSEVRSEAEVWARHLARFTTGLRVVPARNSHITLAFLGDREEDEVGLIAEAMQENGAPVGGLSLGAPVWLPRRRPRSLALEVHDDRGELTELQADLARSLRSSLGWKEERPYRAHLTCARVGRGFDHADLRLPVSPSIAFEAESITLYSSNLSPEGAEYEVLERIPFGPPAQ
ncbi:MAG: RNA 2',3'-cyclic phosphodiesterase [Solirubrobacterales bacterium]|nr:RNA 2',3'-cyclic phosphodiesterase [Solirubrobacterales bacterium]